MKLEIVHSTRYRYTGAIAETVMEVRLQPMDGNGQRCLDFRLELSHGIKPRTYTDGFGNQVHYFNLVKPHSALSVVSRSTVETGLDPDGDPGEELVLDFLRFRSPVKDVEGVRELARRHAIPDASASPIEVEQALDGLTESISREFTYDRTVTNVYSDVDDVLALRAGVCQDFAHLFIAAARAMGVPARYVSGYIHTPGERSVAASHAWAEAWVAGRGWIGFDATHPVRTTPHHVRLAVGRDYTDAAPTRGVYVGSAAGTMGISVKTREVDQPSDMRA